MLKISPSFSITFFFRFGLENISKEITLFAYNRDYKLEWGYLHFHYYVLKMKANLSALNRLLKSKHTLFTHARRLLTNWLNRN